MLTVEDSGRGASPPSQPSSRVLADHDQAGAEGELGVVDDAVLAAVHGLLGGAEGVLQKRHPGVGIGVADGGEDVGMQVIAHGWDASPRPGLAVLD